MATVFPKFASSVVLALIALVGQTPMLAHDMWIEPTTFFPAPGQIVGVRLRVGQDLLGDPLPRDPALIKQFTVSTPAGSKPIIGRDGADPAGLMRVESPGLVVVGYSSNPSFVELTAGKFNEYLKTEGLDGVASLREKRGETAASARELFSRCAKSLLLSGAPSGGQLDQSLGFTLELLAEKNPYVLTVGENLPVRLTYQNKPLAGALVVAINRLKPFERVTARTGKDGRASIPITSGGLWLVKSVHMIPAPAGSNAEWQSYWASLTFERKN